MQKKQKNILISCAGSGGHFYPGLSLAESWQKEQQENSQNQFKKVFVVIEGNKKRSQSQKKILQQKGISYFCFNSPSLPKTKIGFLIFFLKFLKEFLKAIFLLLKYRIDCVLVMGSFANAAIAVAGLLCFKKVYLHESNLVLGKANRFLISYVQKIFGVFPFWQHEKIQHGKWLKKERVKKRFTEKFIQVELPLRKEILDFTAKMKNEKIDLIYQELNLKKNKKTIFLFGGSQGAEKINQIFISFLKKISSQEFQIIHLTGAEKTENQKYIKIYQKNRFDFFVASHFEEIGKCYFLADIVICRSGASTISEIDFFNKKAILIPYPYAIYQHQYHNAFYFCKRKKNTAVIEQKKLTVESLREKFEQLHQKNGEKKNNKKVSTKNLKSQSNSENLTKYSNVADKIFKEIVKKF